MHDEYLMWVTDNASPALFYFVQWINSLYVDLVVNSCKICCYCHCQQSKYTRNLLILDFINAVIYKCLKCTFYPFNLVYTRVADPEPTTLYDNAIIYQG